MRREAVAALAVAQEALTQKYVRQMEQRERTVEYYREFRERERLWLEFVACHEDGATWS